jgi:hypothetical protein
MLDGYTVVVDPTDDFSETDESNNTYSIPGGANLRITWDGMYLRWYPHLVVHTCPNYGRFSANDTDVWVDIYARSEYSDVRQDTWHWSGEIASDGRLYSPGYHGWERIPETTEFFIEPEQNLVIRIRGEQDGESMGSGTAIFENIRNWEVDRLIPTGSVCDDYDLREMGRELEAWPSGTNSWCGSWSVYVNICEIAD